MSVTERVSKFKQDFMVLSGWHKFLGASTGATLLVTATATPFMIGNGIEKSNEYHALQDACQILVDDHGGRAAIDAKIRDQIESGLSAEFSFSEILRTEAVEGWHDCKVVSHDNGQTTAIIATPVNG
jgi:hypothetical protein